MSYDESLNHITWTDQMDLIVRFWDNNKKRVQVCHFDSGFLGHTGAKQLLEKFHELTEKLIPTRLIKISMDGPNVNWKFMELLVESRVEAEIPSLINIGSCGIDVMYAAFKTGAKASGWGVSKILKALARLFLDSPARRADYVEMTGSSLFPMSFCATRWIDDGPVAQCAIQIWDHVGKIVKYWSKLPKSKQPSAKCYSTIEDTVDGKLTVAKFHFFTSVATQLRPFLES